jgi:hypothetical protein
MKAMAEGDHNRDWALRLAEAGIAVFPCGPDKKPLVKWREASTTNAQAIAALWTQYPAALPGIDLAKCGLLVLDGDRHGGPDGRTALKRLLRAQRGEYDGHVTPGAITPGDGAHVYFEQNGHAFGNSRGDLPAGIDVRGVGGYVICPYAVLPDGRRYETVRGMADLIGAFTSGAVPPIPSGIARLLEKPQPEQPRASGASNGTGDGASNGSREAAYAAAALDGIAAELAKAPPGERNNALNAAAYRMATMIARGWISRSDVADALWAACESNGLARDDGANSVQATLASGLRDGENEPHPDLEDRDRTGSDQPNSGARQQSDRATEQDEQQPSSDLGARDAGDDAEPPPPRGWLFGNIFCRKFLSSLLGDGGVGKTALRYAQYLSLAANRSLTGEHLFQRARVLIISLEDDIEELQRRILAVRIHHQVDRDELKGWLFYTAPSAVAGKLMTVDRTGRAMRGRLAASIEAEIIKHGIDLVAIDPFVKSHSVPENENSVIDEVAQVLTDLAAKHNIAIDCPHHISKGPAEPGNANRGRGASAMVNAGRLVFTLTTMSGEEANAFGVAEADRRQYVRVDSGKVNITKAAGEAKWFHIIGVGLGNATDLYPNGDEVQTVEPWKPPEVWSDLSIDLLNQALTQIDAGLPDGNRYSDASRTRDERAAWRVITALAPAKAEAQAREIIKTWVRNGVLVRREYKDPKQRKDAIGLYLDQTKRPSR